MNSSAPTFTTIESTFATVASPAGVTAGLTYAFQKLRVNRLAAPMDMTAAGTSAPTAMAANAKPANQLGKIALKSAGTTSLLSLTFTPGRVGHVAEHGDQAQQHRVGRQHDGVLLMVSPLLEAKIPVSVCGYMNPASALPSARVA